MRSLFLLILAVSPITLNAQIFSESALASGIDHTHLDSTLMGGGAAFFDFNNDGFQDLYLTGGTNIDHLYRNNQNGTYTEIGISAGLGMTDSVKTISVITGDIDNDGYRDIFVTTSEDYSNILFYNNGDDTFTDISASAGITDTVWTMCSAFGDYNRDGFIDLYTGDYVTYWDVPFYWYILDALHNNLYLNNGNNTFTDVSVVSNAGIKAPTLALTFTDYDNDLDVDLIIANDFGGPYSHNHLLRNNYPSNEFVDISLSSGLNYEINAMGIAIGDYDEDLDLDYYITNMWENLLHTNNGDHTFGEAAQQSGLLDSSVVSWGTFFFDYNNDTYLDLFSSSGQVMPPELPEPNSLFLNDQTGYFNNVALNEGIQDTCKSRGAIYADIENDGDLDILVVNMEMDTALAKNASFYSNSLNGSANWLELKLEGTISNRDAYGAHIYLYADGRAWMREINGGSTYLSQNSSVVHFGLGSITSIDSVQILWPSGIVQVESSVPINQISTLVETDYTGLNEIHSPSFQIYPNPAGDYFYCILDASINATELSIATLGGAIVQREKLVPGALQQVDVVDLMNGVYFVQITGDKNVVTRKVVIRH